MARIKSPAENKDDTKRETKRPLKRAKKKRAINDEADVIIRDISDVSGKVQVAGHDIVTHEHYEEATAARTEKEFKIYELEELKASLFEKIESLKIQSSTPSKTDQSFHPNALELNEGPYLLGREENLRHLTERFVAEQSIFISGRAGVGRTSLLQAGLMPYFLEQGHLPVLISISAEPLDLIVKRKILTGVDSTTYLKRLNLAKFLEHVTKFLQPNKWLLLLLDDFENIYEQHLEEEHLRAFEMEWGLTKANRKLRWLFSIDHGFRARLAPFDPHEPLEVPPLERVAAAQAIQGLEQDGLRVDEAYSDEILNELAKHRGSLEDTRINPSDIQIILQALAEASSSGSLSRAYEEKGRVNGIFRAYLADTIDNEFPSSYKPVLWQVLTVLNEKYGTLVSARWIESEIKRSGFGPEQVSELLRGLRKAHLIRARDEKYELANVNLRRAIHDRLEEETRLQTALENARNEYRRQLDNIRASALRGMLAGGVGFAAFRWIVGGLVRNPLDLVFLTLLYASIGGMTGLLLTFSTDVFIARFRERHSWQRYLLSTASGLVMFGLALAIYVYQTEHIGNQLLPLGLAAVVGGAWGSVAGAGMAWAMGSLRLQLWKILLTAAASALTLFLFNRFLPVLNRPEPLQLLLGGFWLPLVLLTGILFWKRADPD
jgi:hypothetical protein